MKAFRADLQQKSFNARKTNNYEDRINVTYKGMVSENSEEHYKTLSENLEKSVSFLSGLLRAAEYQSINLGIQNALRGRSNLYEASAPPALPAPGAPAWIQPLLPPVAPEAPAAPAAPAQAPPKPNLPLQFPTNPSPGDRWIDPSGYTWEFDKEGDGSWHIISSPRTPKPPKPAPKPDEKPSKPAKPKPPAEKPKPAPRPKAKPTVRSPVTGEPVNPNYRPQR